MNRTDKTDPGRDVVAPVTADVGLTFEQATHIRLGAIVAEQAAQRALLATILAAVKNLGTVALATYERRIKKLEKRVTALESGR